MLRDRTNVSRVCLKKQKKKTAHRDQPAPSAFSHTANEEVDIDCELNPDQSSCCLFLSALLFQRAWFCFLPTGRVLDRGAGRADT